MRRSFLGHFVWILFQDSAAGFMFHSHRGGWRWQKTCTAWTCLRIWWCCATRSCLIWSLLPLLRQSWCGFLLSIECDPCTELLPGSWTLLIYSSFWPFVLNFAHCLHCTAGKLYEHQNLYKVVLLRQTERMSLMKVVFLGILVYVLALWLFLLSPLRYIVMPSVTTVHIT